jgi:hypothetical protein
MKVTHFLAGSAVALVESRARRRRLVGVKRLGWWQGDYCNILDEPTVAGATVWEGRL